VTKTLTTVMYHYVRPLAQSAYPRLKALELDDFVGQLDHLCANYNVLSPRVFQDIMTTGQKLPDRACLLTFDDGYIDHYAYVFPHLVDRGLAGYFFAPRSSLVDRQLLDVNRIQFTLAAHSDPNALADELDRLLLEQGLGDPEALRAQHFLPNRYDGPDVGYIKRVLQHGLSEHARDAVTRQLFARHVSNDEAGFADGLYLTAQHAKTMIAEGMVFGGHGDKHLWHELCDAPSLIGEIAGSVATLGAVDHPTTGAAYCYPYGSTNDKVCDAAAAAGFSFGFTVVPDVWQLNGDQMRISRLDTNDLPHAPDKSCAWLARVS